MKRSALPLAASALILLAGCDLSAPRRAAPPAAPTIRTVATWALYYGPATDEAIARLSGYGLIVIDPHALGDRAREAIAKWRSEGSLVAGYLSFFEVAAWHRYRDRIPQEWYILRDDGQPWSPWANKNVGWDANLAASLAEPGWRGMLCDLVKSEVLDYGCDGVFMDTLEDVDFASMPEKEREPQVEGLRALMAQLDGRYPEVFFIGNRTLGRALDAVEAHIDAVCWESFRPKYFRDPDTRKWMEETARRLGAARDKYGVRTFALCCEEHPGDDYEADMASIAEIAAGYGYPLYCIPGNYHTLPTGGAAGANAARPE